MSQSNTQIAAANMPTTYLKNFFLEKDIAPAMFELQSPRTGEMHYIPNSVVVEHFVHLDDDQAEHVSRILRNIDFANGDVNHFLEHMAGWVVQCAETRPS